MTSPVDPTSAPHPASVAPAPAGSSATVLPENPHRIQSHEVMRGQNAVAIEHNGNVYRLQTTRQGKLILTK